MLSAESQDARIAVAFAREAARSDAAHLCSACVSFLDVDGAGITLMGGEHTGPVCCSNERMRGLEELQFTLGEGPCHDAYQRNEVVSATDLRTLGRARWPAFSALARESGVNAVFAYPLVAAKAKVGVLTVYQDDIGPLTSNQHTDSAGVARILALMVLSLQSGRNPDSVSDPLDAALAARASVHQASGMVALQLTVSVPEALARIRAYAYANELGVNDVAAAIVARELRLRDDRETESLP